MEKRRYLVIVCGVMFLFVLTFSSANMIILWNGTQASVPSGWTCVSCTASFNCPDISDPPLCDFWNTIPREANTYCGAGSGLGTPCGGSETHFHPLSANSSLGNANTTATSGVANGFTTASTIHFHNSVNESNTLANNSYPLSFSFLFISFNAGVPTQIPAGGIIFYNKTTAPTNFSMYTTADGKFPIGNITATLNYGNITSNHSSQALKTGNPDVVLNSLAGVKSVGSDTHTCNVNGTSKGVAWNTNDSIVPPYVDMPLIYATALTNIPIGAIGMFNVTPATNWLLINDTVGKYIRANSTSFNTTGGNLTHSHGIQTFTTGACSGAFNSVLATQNVTSSAHTHTITITTEQTVNQPPYTNVTLYLFNTSAVSNTCSYSGSGDWQVLCSDMCNITTSYSLPNNNLILRGIGTFNLFANLNVKTIIKETLCRFVKPTKMRIT